LSTNKPSPPTMSKKANIHQLRGGCASLEVQFTSDVEDDVDDYSDAQTKLDLARDTAKEYIAYKGKLT
jgi:hypothetical protein